jgi:hypothetical protein
MKPKFLTLCLICLMMSNFSNAQNNGTDLRRPDIVNLGLGFGFDYGGIGMNFMGYPQKNIGLFFGGGYAIAGFGYNAGVKLRLSPDRGATVVNPYFTAMYGYNAAVAISGSPQFDKLFYGPSLGVGIDIRSRKLYSKSYLSLAILVPIRNSDAQNYIDFLKNDYGASFSNSLLPIGISIGYKFILN